MIEILPPEGLRRETTGSGARCRQAGQALCAGAVAASRGQRDERRLAQSKVSGKTIGRLCAMRPWRCQCVLQILVSESLERRRRLATGGDWASRRSKSVASFSCSSAYRRRRSSTHMMTANDCFMQASRYRAEARASTEQLEHALLLEAAQRWQRHSEIALAKEADNPVMSANPPGPAIRSRFLRFTRISAKSSSCLLDLDDPDCVIRCRLLKLERVGY